METLTMNTLRTIDETKAIAQARHNVGQDQVATETDALKWSNEVLPEAPATKGRYMISVSGTVRDRMSYSVTYQPDGTHFTERALGPFRTVDAAKRKAQIHHDAGRDR
jgi:hypothetical protein